jgi:hypothetical protein
MFMEGNYFIYDKYKKFLFRLVDEKTFHNHEKNVQNQHIQIQDGHHMLKILWR